MESIFRNCKKSVMSPQRKSERKCPANTVKSLELPLIFRVKLILEKKLHQDKFRILAPSVGNFQFPLFLLQCFTTIHKYR